MLAALATLFALTGHAQESGTYKTLRTACPQDIGALKPVDHNSTVVVALHLKDEDGLLGYVGDIINPMDQLLPPYLSRDHFRKQYVPDSEQVRQVSSYLESFMFSKIHVGPNKTLIIAKGSLATIERAFPFNTGSYITPSGLGQKRTPQAAIHRALDLSRIPQYLRGTIAAVILSSPATDMPSVPAPRRHQLYEFDDDHLLRQPSHEGDGLPSQPRSNELPPEVSANAAVIALGDLNQAMAAVAPSFHRPDGSQLHIKVVKVGDWRLQPLPAFDQAAALEALVATAGAQTTLTFYNAPGRDGLDLLLSIDRAVADDQANVILIPESICEADAYGSGLMNAIDRALAQGVAQGQTFVTEAPGDSWNSCHYRSLMFGGLPYPATSPLVVSVGSPSAPRSPAVPMTAQTSHRTTSAYEPMWNWDNDDALSISSYRAIPDISYDISSFVTARSTVNLSGSRLRSTIAAAHIAGMLAQIESENGNSLGFARPLLYRESPMLAPLYQASGRAPALP
jgi:hypothetical protein